MNTDKVKNIFATEVTEHTENITPKNTFSVISVSSVANAFAFDLICVHLR